MASDTIRCDTIVYIPYPPIIHFLLWLSCFVPSCANFLLSRRPFLSLCLVFLCLMSCATYCDNHDHNHDQHAPPSIDWCFTFNVLLTKCSVASVHETYIIYKGIHWRGTYVNTERKKRRGGGRTLGVRPIPKSKIKIRI